MGSRIAAVVFVVALMLSARPVRAEVVVLDETPVAEFSLPDGSVLKNAFVWRRSSQGLMIVHDDGQFFLNYKTLPPEWQAAYLGTPEEIEEPEPVVEKEPVSVDDRYSLATLLSTVPGLTSEGVEWLLREDPDEESELAGLSIALHQSLLTDRRESAKRYLLIIEERKLDSEAVRPETLFDECIVCGGKGEYEQPCPDCGGSGKCSECEGSGILTGGVGRSEKECPECDAGGICLSCDGAKKMLQPCGNCRGRGQLLDKAYCEVQRERLVHYVRVMAEGLEVLPLTRQKSTQVPDVLATLPDLNPETLTYLTSDGYDGTMDTNVVAACLLQSALNDRWDLAARFNHLLEAEFPDNDIIDIGDYLRPCSDCDQRGFTEEKCTFCGEEEGQCAECEGTGEVFSQFRLKTDCSECKGTGICRYCAGDGMIKLRCPRCESRGREFEKMRAEVKLELLVGGINRYHRRVLRAPSEEEAGTNQVEDAEAPLSNGDLFDE